MEFYNTVKDYEYPFEKAYEFFWKFIGTIQQNRPLILLAQRDYINDVFRDYNQMEDLDDTNVPWDWDHIYPSEWVYRKGKINQSIKDWNNTNGNFRVLALEQNRKEGNSLSPAVRLENMSIRELSFVKEDWDSWQHIEARIMDHQIQPHFVAITTRMINIYQKFWDDFKINDMIDMDYKKSEPYSESQ